MNHDPIVQASAIRAATDICAKMLKPKLSRVSKEEIPDALISRAKIVAALAKVILAEMEKS